MTKKLNLDLDLAVADNNLDAVNKLIDQGADPLYYDEEIYEPAIQTSARKGYVEIFNLLFEKIGRNANVNIPYSGSLLISACSNCSADLEVTRALVESGAELNFQNEEGYTALQDFT